MPRVSKYKAARTKLDVAVYERFRAALDLLPVPRDYADLQKLTSAYSQLVTANKQGVVLPGEKAQEERAEHKDRGNRLASALKVIARHGDGLNTTARGNHRDKDLPVSDSAEDIAQSDTIAPVSLGQDDLSGE